MLYDIGFGLFDLKILCHFNNFSVISPPGSRRYQISEIEVARPGFEPRTLVPTVKSLLYLRKIYVICSAFDSKVVTERQWSRVKQKCIIRI